jgi:hypothetical protein
MRDLAIHDHDLILATHGRSFWILDDITPIEQNGTTAPRGALLVRPADAYTMRRSVWTDTPIPPDEPTAANPPAGAIIDYFLPRDARRPVELEVLDSRGDLVRRFRSDDKPGTTDEELARELIPRYWIAPFQALPSSRGVHRFVWDLQYPAPVSTTRGYPISAAPHATPRGPEGPHAVPGAYTVRLTVDGKRLEAPLLLKADPRVTLSSDSYAEQLHLSRQLADLLTTSSRTLLSARSEREQLKALGPKGSTLEPVKSFDAQLGLLDAAEKKTEEAAAQKGTLTEVQKQLDTLYAQVIQADAQPTRAQKEAADAARAALSGLLRSWQTLQAGLPGLNRVLLKNHLAAIRASQLPVRDLNAADED